MVDRERRNKGCVWHKLLPWLRPWEDRNLRHEDTTGEALGAIFKSRDERDRADELWIKIEPATGGLRREAHRNHFAERFEIAYKRENER